MPLANCFFIYPMYATETTVQSFRNSITTDYCECIEYSVSLGSMTPADHVDPPTFPFHLINQQEDQSQFFISANHASSSVSCPSFCTIIRDHRGARVPDVSPNDHEHGTQNLHMAGSSNHQMYSTATLPDIYENTSSFCGHNLALQKYKLEEGHTNISSSAQWMPSKMRLMHRMMTANRSASEKPIKNFPRSQNQQHGCSEINTGSSSANNTTRVCSDCNTTTTPLWRSGPRGPKSLCNACGIRQRKQRKAMSEASAATAEASSANIGRIMHNKEKKPRPAGAATCKSQGDDQRQLSFNDLKLSWRSSSASQQLFPQDEVAEAASLLMELSYGFLHV